MDERIDAAKSNRRVAVSVGDLPEEGGFRP